MKGLTVRRTHFGTVICCAPGTDATSFSVGNMEGALVLEQLSDFDEFFAPLYQSIQSYYWLIKGAVYNFPLEWDRWFDGEQDRYRGPELDASESEHLAQDYFWSLVKPGFLERYAEHLSGDWLEILGFTELPEDPQSILRLSSSDSLTPMPKVEVAFFCIDGMHWDFFARDDKLLSLVQQHLCLREDLDVFEIGIKESVSASHRLTGG